MEREETTTIYTQRNEVMMVMMIVMIVMMMMLIIVVDVDDVDDDGDNLVIYYGQLGVWFYLY